MVRVQVTRRLRAALFVLCAAVAGAVAPVCAVARAAPRQILPAGHVQARLVPAGVAPVVVAPAIVAPTPRAIPLRVRNPAGYARAKRAAAGVGSSTPHPASSPGASPSIAATAVFGTLNAPGLSASQQISTFQGNGDITPPDTTGAVGPADYVEIVNSEIAVYRRTDLTPVTSALSVGTFTGGADPCDVQVKYDPGSDRWYYLALRCDGTSTDNQLYVGWSKSSDPSSLTTGWCKFTVDSTPTTLLDDYPKLGLDASHVIIGANGYDATSEAAETGFQTAQILVGAKPPAGTIGPCTAPSFTVFGSSAAPLLTSRGNLAFTPEPATVSDTSSTTGYVVAADFDDSGGDQSGSALMLWQIGGSAGSPTLAPVGDVAVTAFAVPPAVPQPVSNDTIDSLDGRLTQAVAAADPGDIGAEAVWTQHTISDGMGGSVVRWYELVPSTMTLLQSGTVTDSAGFAFNGAIAPTRSGGAVIDYNAGGSSEQVQLMAQSRAAFDTAGAMSGPTALLGSSAVDSDFSCPSQPVGSGPAGTGVCRWGDYAGASVDPDNPDVAWGSNQVNGPTGAFIARFGDQAQWQTENFALTPAATPAPTASFTVSPNPVSPGSPVTLDASASSDPNSGGGITDYSWSFGDGTADQDTHTTASTPHTYANAGVYVVTLTVTASGGTSSTTHVVTVDAPPTASFTASPNPVTPGVALSFNAGASVDPNPGGTIGSYTWAFGDGTGATGATASHSYGTPGSYPVTLTVMDEHGQSASQTQTVIVDRPAASFTASPNPSIPGAPVAFNAGGSSDAIGAITAYSWSFGDGATAGGATPSHTFTTPGGYVVTLTVTNNYGQTATSSVLVTVNPPPTASFTIIPNPAVVRTPVGFDASGSTRPAGVSAGYTWAFGDGGTASGPVVSHRYTTPGTYAVTLIVVDSDGQSATTIERVTVKAPALRGRLAIVARQRLAGIRGRGLVVTLSTNQARRAIFSLAARISGRSRRRPASLTLLRGRTFNVGAGSHRITLKLSRAAARTLSAQHVASLAVTVKLVDAFGQTLTLSASLRL